MPDKNKGAMTTSKKQKFVGTKVYIDAETGETVPMQVRALEERDFNFHKVWLQHFINGMDNIVNQKLRLAFWIIDNLDYENKLVKTQRQMAKETGISFRTVNLTIKALCEPGESGAPFLQKMHSGAYRVNPDVIFKGSHSNRMGIVFDYSKKLAEDQPVATATIEQLPGQVSLLESVNPDEQGTDQQSESGQSSRISAFGG